MSDKDKAEETAPDETSLHRSAMPPRGMMALAAAGLGGIMVLAIATTSRTGTPGAPSTEPATPQTSAEEDTLLAMPASMTTEREENADLRIADAETVDFIVRFKDDIDAIETCLSMPRDQIEETRKIFSDWAAADPAMSGMVLKKISYSDEFILTWNSGIHRPLLRTEMTQKLEALKAMPGVKYADPDYTAQPRGHAK